MVGSASGQKQSVKFLLNTVYTAQSPPPQTHTVCINCTFSLRRGGGGEEVREKIEGQQYTSIVPSSMGATVHKLGRKYQPMSECIPVYKICETQCRNVVNRSILKKSRHIGIGLLQFNPSTGQTHSLFCDSPLLSMGPPTANASKF